MVALFVFLTFILFIGVDLVISYATRRVTVAETQPVRRAVLSYPTGLFFSRQHTWASLAGEKEVQVGLGDFISNLVGKVDSIDVAEGEISTGKPLFTIMQGDKKLVLPSPVNGKITRVNEDVLANPSMLKIRPLSRQWIVMMESDDPASDLRPLQMASEAKSWIVREAARFVESYGKIFGNPEYAPSLADGGTLVEGALSYGDAESWSKFQDEFIQS